MRIDYIDDEKYIENRKKFKAKNKKDFKIIEELVIKRLLEKDNLNNPNDSFTLTFFCNIKKPNFIYIEKTNSKYPALDYFMIHYDSNIIKEIDPILDMENFDYLEVCKISNKQCDLDHNYHGINI